MTTAFYLTKMVPDLATTAWELLFQLVAEENGLPLLAGVPVDRTMAQRQIFGEELIEAGLAYADENTLYSTPEGEAVVHAFEKAYERARAK
jgi:hypothetical protein